MDAEVRALEGEVTQLRGEQEVMLLAAARQQQEVGWGSGFVDGVDRSSSF